MCEEEVVAYFKIQFKYFVERLRNSAVMICGIRAQIGSQDL
jgi:hypothetical protein